MYKRQWFGWIVHARQERADYMALVAIVATFGVGMIAVGGYLVETAKRHSSDWLANVLLIAGVVIILLTVLSALLLGALPIFTRPKLRLGKLSCVPYTDEEVEAMGRDYGGVRRSVCVQVEVNELRGVKAREVEVWLTAISPEPEALPIALPVPLEVFDLSKSIMTDVSAKSRRYFKLLVEVDFVNGGDWSVSRIGVRHLPQGEITLELHHESWTPDTRIYKIPDDIDDTTNKS